MFQNIIGLAHKHQILSQLHLIQQFDLRIEKIFQHQANKKKCRLEGYAKMDIHQPSLNDFNSQAVQICDHLNIRTKFYQECKLPNYDDIFLANHQNEPYRLSSQDGQVLIILLCNFQSQDQLTQENYFQTYQTLMASNQSLWKQKVRFVAIIYNKKLSNSYYNYYQQRNLYNYMEHSISSSSLSDNDSDSDNQNKQQKQQPKLKLQLKPKQQQQQKKNIFHQLSQQHPHIQMLKIKKYHKIMNDYNIRQLPHLLIVDKHGITKYSKKGYQIDIKNIEKLIYELINQQKQNSPEEQLILNYEKQEKVQNYQNLLKIFQEDQFNTNYQDAVTFSINATGNRQWKFNQYLCQTKITITYSQNDINLLNKFKTYISGIKDLIIQQKFVQLIQIPIGKYCVQCKEQLESNFYYWCKWDGKSNQFRCIQCIQKKNGSEYNYNNNAVLTKGTNMFIALSRFGKNLQPTSRQQRRNKHSFICDSCRKYPQENTVRYICLGCYPEPKEKWDYVDLCSICMEKYINNNPIVYQNLKYRHSHQYDHPFLRVLYNTNGYSDF